MYENHIVRLDGKLWRNNPQLTSLYFSGNEINEIERNFIEVQNNLERLDLRWNNCVDHFFLFEGDQLPLLNTTLQTCFHNFETPVEITRKFAIRIEGNLTLTEL